ncbi:CTLH/CRAto LisH motif domain-containing protein [Rozella allomycis CSF55]|uniref:CTLH/CRAto LisH motif domain-containing protein n=1 Tax=Rozella allomycis (strain CSF55) TaxID=988480 RepID=A0A075B0L0_ROZAC|nr:CTLH/CRAto LisH motif domain-containing protein [Rozella allomycis CSF55]|eukprot:EPZ34346.1 CTLH/CRAto LisH motif domain-containing protein [Rozella allomycis CSF55]
MLGQELEESFSNEVICVTDVQRIVFNYLVDECYEETANAFLHAVCGENPEESMEIDNSTNQSQFDITSYAWRTLGDRKVIYRCIQLGCIEEALDLCWAKFPKSLATNANSHVHWTKLPPESLTSACFELLCQRFIEFLRNGKSKEALEYAQSVLGPIAQTKEEYMKALQDIVSLIAYENPYQSPSAFYLNEDRKSSIASLVNRAILNNFGPSKKQETCLETLIKQLTIVNTLIGPKNAFIMLGVWKHVDGYYICNLKVTRLVS